MSSVEWTEESIQTAYQKIWKYELDWVILGYEIGTPKRIGIKSSGSTVDLFVSNFKEDEILLGYIRYDQAAMFIHFLPKSVRSIV
ncbi:hypothetical protein BC833DRAFT_395113 [Globomyces pollinis-pini]|nr:hypothetical protein BC833DRAFT_395113 [Globomyces pollinis-pini]